MLMLATGKHHPQHHKGPSRGIDARTHRATFKKMVVHFGKRSHWETTNLPIFLTDSSSLSRAITIGWRKHCRSGSLPFIRAWETQSWSFCLALVARAFWQIKQWGRVRGPNFSKGAPGRHCRAIQLCCDSIFDCQKNGR